jgi:hypothetical protein
VAKQGWNRWKEATIGLAVILTTVIVTAWVVANWDGKGQEKETVKPAAKPARVSPPPRQVAATPGPSDIDACNRYARSVAATTPSSPTADVLKDAVIGGAIGAGVGAAGGAIAGGGKGAGKGAAIGGIVGATAGTLYGLNEANKQDSRSVDAYRTCMRQRGYVKY